MAHERYSSVLVPLDGTAFAEAAVRPAAELASRSGGSIHLVSVVSRPLHEGQMVSMSLAPLPESGVTRSVSRVQLLEDELSEVAEQVSEEWECGASFEVVTGEPTADTLLQAAERRHADLIVAATHSKGLITRALLGSTSAELSREASCPVLLVPSEDAEPDPEETPMQGAVHRIAVALGADAELDDAVLGNALTQALLWEASLVLIHAVPVLTAPAAAAGATVPSSFGPGLAEDARSVMAAEERLEKLVAALGDFGIDTTAEVVQAPRAADAVLEHAERLGADLLVVGRHERGVWERLWAGSESDRLARHIRSIGLLVCPLGKAA
jgi:nucleotide-binding universal stress UspA family protein